MVRSTNSAVSVVTYETGSYPTSIGSERKSVLPYFYYSLDQLTTLRFSSVINGDCGSRLSDKNVRNATAQSKVGEESLIWFLFTFSVIIDLYSVGSSDISCFKHNDLISHPLIVTINNPCVLGVKLKIRHRHTHTLQLLQPLCLHAKG